MPGSKASRFFAHRGWRWLVRGSLLCLSLQWLPATDAHAAAIYKCVDARGNLAFQDMPCATPGGQQQLTTVGQPLIDAAAPPPSVDPAATGSSSRRTGARSARAPAPARPSGSRKKSAAEFSWECRAANGEVFYRHARCPSTVAGDGVVRERYVEHRNGPRTRTDRGAWGRVPVHGTKITRAAACRRMDAASTAGRDGHLRDQRVSTYDRLMGRDPCMGG